MDDDRRLVVPDAKTIPFRLAGTWNGHDWMGTASAGEELAGVILVRDANGMSWSRSRRTGSSGLELRFSAGSDPALAVTWYSVDLGGGQCWGRIAGKLELEFANPEPVRALRTGSVVWLPICTEGELPLEIGLLALAKTDVKFGRKRIWRLHPRLWESLDDELRLLLVDRRSGTLPE